MPFPDKCIRGIPNDSFLLEGPLVSSTLFPFDSNRSKEDGWIPESINWMDHGKVISFTLEQKKENGEEQFHAGVAILPRNEMDRLKRRAGITGFFDYERSPLPNNDCHGNILLKKTIPPTLKTMIRAALALSSEVLLRPENKSDISYLNRFIIAIKEFARFLRRGVRLFLPR